MLFNAIVSPFPNSIITGLGIETLGLVADRVHKMLRTPSATKPQMGSLIITQLQTQMMLQEKILHPQLTFTAILSSEAGLALTPAEHALPVAKPRAAARAALSELPLCRHADADGLRLAVVVVEGDEPVPVGQVQRQVLLHSLLQWSDTVQT